MNFVKPNFEVFKNGTWYNENILSNGLGKDMNNLIENAKARENEKENFEQKSTMYNV